MRLEDAKARMYRHQMKEAQWYRSMYDTMHNAERGRPVREILRETSPLQSPRGQVSMALSATPASQLDDPKVPSINYYLTARLQNSQKYIVMADTKHVCPVHDSRCIKYIYYSPTK